MAPMTSQGCSSKTVIPETRRLQTEFMSAHSTVPLWAALDDESCLWISQELHEHFWTNCLVNVDTE